MRGLQSTRAPSLQNLSRELSTCTAPGGQRALRYRLVILGSCRVGKTALAARFLGRAFPEHYRPTVEEMHTAEYTVCGRKVTLEILDTSGSYEFPAMRRLAYDKGDAFLLVYALDDPSSFEALQDIRQSLYERRTSPLALVVGNKADLETERARAVTESVVRLDWEHPYVECSAKTDLAISPAFHQLLVDLVKDEIPDEDLKEIIKPTNKKKVSRRRSVPFPPQLVQRMSKVPLIKRHSCIIS